METISIPSWLVALLMSVAGSLITYLLSFMRVKVILEMVERTVKKLHERVDNLQEFCAELRTEVVTLKALRDEDREIRREKTGAYRITRKSNDDEGEDT